MRQGPTTSCSSPRAGRRAAAERKVDHQDTVAPVLHCANLRYEQDQRSGVDTSAAQYIYRAAQSPPAREAAGPPPAGWLTLTESEVPLFGGTTATITQHSAIAETASAPARSCRPDSDRSTMLQLGGRCVHWKPSRELFWELRKHAKAEAVSFQNSYLPVSPSSSESFLVGAPPRIKTDREECRRCSTPGWWDRRSRDPAAASSLADGRQANGLAPELAGRRQEYRKSTTGNVTGASAAPSFRHCLSAEVLCDPTALTVALLLHAALTARTARSRRPRHGWRNSVRAH